MKRHGIGASTGIAIAKVLILAKTNQQSFSKKNPNDLNPHEEYETFSSAVLNVKKLLNNLIKKTEAKLGKKNAEIFQAHISILEDPEIEARVKELIMQKDKSAAAAVESAYTEFYNIFKNIDDEYLRERTSDIIDVKTKIINSIIGADEIELDSIDEEVIIVANDLTPSETSQLDPKFIKGFVCEVGSKTSHSAIMARTLGIPAILGLKDATKLVQDKEIVAIDGSIGEFAYQLSYTEIDSWKTKEKEWKNYQKVLKNYKGQPTVTSDGHIFYLEANVGSDKDIDSVIANDAQGIGLFRTEFLYMEKSELPSEQEQFNSYQKILQSVKGKVVIRTLDIGGDKDLSYLKMPKEMNPFLGYRAIRLCLDQQSIFKTQLRALLRASVFGELAIMFPMIATVEEFEQAKQLFNECKKELATEGQKFSNNIKLGMMIEIPAAAINSDIFAKHADFFSIGTNDLIQYTMAADRMSENVAYLYQPYHPAVLRLIKMTIDSAKNGNRKIPVGMCGEMAGDQIAVPLLVGMGLDEYSMPPSAILPTRKLINSLNKKEMEKLVALALQCETSAEVKSLVANTLHDTLN